MASFPTTWLLGLGLGESTPVARILGMSDHGLAPRPVADESEEEERFSSHFSRRFLWFAQLLLRARRFSVGSWQGMGRLH